jgi:hypothetical protein
MPRTTIRGLDIQAITPNTGAEFDKLPDASSSLQWCRRERARGPKSVPALKLEQFGPPGIPEPTGDVAKAAQPPSPRPGQLDPVLNSSDWLGAWEEPIAINSQQYYLTSARADRYQPLHLKNRCKAVDAPGSGLTAAAKHRSFTKVREEAIEKIYFPLEEHHSAPAQGL